jgi:hypothetical protein
MEYSSGVEHLSDAQTVVGSNPIIPTKYRNGVCVMESLLHFKNKNGCSDAAAM